MRNFPSFKQSETKDCGPTCLKIIGKYYGRNLEINRLRELSETTREGSSLFGLSEAIEKVGFRSLGVQWGYNQLKKATFPCIVHWKESHYVVPYKIQKDKVYVSDPAHGLVTYTPKEFIENWIGPNATPETQEGVTLLVEPAPSFYQEEDEKEQKLGLSFITKYLFKYRRFIVQLVIGLLVASLLQLIVPFLTQGVVDVGIKNLDMDFVYMVLVAQLSLYLGKAFLEIIRSWILLHLTTRINIELVSDFFIKLMNLPISYFDTKITGDLMQRINDHQRIEQVLTTSSITTLFSTFNLAVFSVVLFYYNWEIFSIFFVGTTFYFGWVFFFFKRRKELDFKRFAQISKEQSKVIELINGMQEIKLHNAERRMRWTWEYMQAGLFRIASKGLRLEQTQSVGSNLINEIKNVLITILSAKLVIDGEITLGMMLSITFIVGQLNGPISQLIQFFRDMQDARISVERLSEIHNMSDEEPVDKRLTHVLPKTKHLTLDNISFRYKNSDDLFSNLSLKIPENKTTAIVGTSGSGKTTLMKLLLRFYDPAGGRIMVGHSDIQSISQSRWRQSCGIVMQDGYIFNDTITRNIAVGEEEINMDHLMYVAGLANIGTFIEGLPMGYHTTIGSEGMGLSAGQKQRILIARALYKNPEFLFFDEATSALDADNEMVVMNNLDRFLVNRTAVVVAHRLSTVKNAHQIIVLEGGKVKEQGTHAELVKKRGRYFELVRNQLELGN